MKKLLSILLSVLMLAGLTIPALAADMDDDLAEITAKVKETLSVADDYTEFSGSWDDWLGGRWNLWWNKDGGSLSVTADENGKVLDVWRYDDAMMDKRFYGFDPLFPAAEESTAMEQCENWLARLVTEPEMAVVEDSRIELADGSYWVSGTVYINAMPSPITFQLRLDGEGVLTSWSRSDSYDHYVGEIPTLGSSVAKTDAEQQLAQPVSFELYWVSDGSGNASLRYVPNFPRTVVDAESGESVDMDALYASFAESGMGMETPAMAEEAMAAMDNGARGKLTGTELAAVDAYAHAKPLAELDEPLRAIRELGLDEGFALENGDYSQNTDGDISVTLRYTKEMTDDQLYGYSRESYEEIRSWSDSMTIEKYITLDAKTGELQELWTYYPVWEKDEMPASSEASAEVIGESFLKQVAPEKLAMSGRCTLKNVGEYVWAQVEQGYFFPENRMELEINTASGTVDRYYSEWDDAVSFGGTDVIGADKAAQAYTDAMTVRLGYVAWPVEVSDDPVFRPYADAGYRWVESLKPAWYYESREDMLGIDALTGEVIRADDGIGHYEYSDLASCAEREAIEHLGRAGVGLSGGAFEPQKVLDMRTAARLLLAAAGWYYEDMDDEAMRQNAQNLGILEKGVWEPDAELNRMDFLHMLLCAGPYGEALKLDGAWSVSFWDKRSLDSAEYGHAAVARALGLVTETRYDFAALITRGEAAQMLCDLMSR